MPPHVTAPRHVSEGTLCERIDKTAQGKGLGRALLAEIIRRSVMASGQVSARLVIVPALSAAAEAFYLHHGFTRLPVDHPTLALDLTKLQKIDPGP